MNFTSIARLLSADDNSVDNLEHYVIDQIALEGLDGITLDTLWKNLDSRYPNFNCLTDASYQKFIWNAIIVKHLCSSAGPRLQAFYIPPETSNRQTIATTSTNQTTIPINSIKKNSRASKIDLFMSPIQAGDVRGS